MKEKEKIYYKVTETEVSPEDGFVDKKEIFPNYSDAENELFYGYGKNTSFETNDPRLALPFLAAVCSIFFIVGLLIIIGSILAGFYPIAVFGLIFIGFSSYAYIEASKDVRKIAQDNELDVDFGLFHNLRIGYRMLRQVMIWPIKTVIDILKKLRSR